MCLRLETMNYQPKPNGLERSQKQIDIQRERRSRSPNIEKDRV